MGRTARALLLFGAPSRADALEWGWVDGQLRDAGTYWLVAPGVRVPHPRPVWGVWRDERVYLSVGSPALRRAAGPGVPVTVHLDSGTDVVIVDGVVAGLIADADVVGAYDDKYDWSYDVERYGPLHAIAPAKISAWRARGVAGRDGFRATGCWTYTARERGSGERAEAASHDGGDDHHDDERRPLPHGDP